MKRDVIGFRRAMLGLALVALALPAVAGLEDFKLTRAIPADAALVVHSRDHEGRAFLKQQFERVWKTAENQHFERDLRTLLKGLAEQQGGDLEAFDKTWQQFNDLILGVEWCTLWEREFAFTMKMSFPMPEFVFLGAAAPEKVKSNFAGLEAILKSLIGMAPEGALVLATQGEGDSVAHVISVANSPFPIGMTLAREKDVLLLGMGETMPEQTLALLRGQTGQTLAATERFQTAVKRLPPPGDELVFFDLARFLGQFHAYMDKALGMAGAGSEQLDPKIKALPAKALDAVDLFDYVAAVSTTKGMKTTGECLAVLKADAKGKPLYNVFLSNGSVKDPLKFIPQEAQNFSVWSGVNLRALYDAVVAFIQSNVPNGEELLAQWETQKAELKTNAGLDFETDLINWVGGGFSTFSLPAKSAYSQPAGVLMLSVKDEAKAREMLGRLFETLTPLLDQQKGMIADAKIEGAEDFKLIVHPALAMIPGLGQPTLGVKEGQLFIGSSPKAVAAALDTAGGKTPNFAKNERFLKEGLPLEANVYSAGFTDLTKMGEEIGQFLQMVPMIGMFAPQVAQNPVGRAAISAASKAGKVVQELNFLQSSCTQTTFDGQVLHSKIVTNYREPPPKPVTTAPAEEKPAEPKKEEPTAGKK